VERCFLALMNVGCEVLREGVAYRASDIDVVYLYGYGFPAYRGGPMFWAENAVGLKVALEKLRKYSAQTGGTLAQGVAAAGTIGRRRQRFASVGA